MKIDTKKQEKEREKLLKDINKVIWRSDKQPKKLGSFTDKQEK